MAVVSNNDSVMLEVVHSVYKKKVKYEVMPEGDLFPQEKEVLHKQIRVKKWFKKEAISSVEEYVTSKNTIAKNRCIVFDKYSGRFYATFHQLHEVVNKLEPQPYKNQIGFTYDTKVYTTGPQVHQHKTRGSTRLGVGDKLHRKF
jgi:hypothetical protein